MLYIGTRLQNIEESLDVLVDTEFFSFNTSASVANLLWLCKFHYQAND